MRVIHEQFYSTKCHRQILQTHTTLGGTIKTVWYSSLYHDAPYISAQTGMIRLSSRALQKTKTTCIRNKYQYLLPGTTQLFAIERFFLSLHKRVLLAPVQSQCLGMRQCGNSTPGVMRRQNKKKNSGSFTTTRSRRGHNETVTAMEPTPLTILPSQRQSGARAGYSNHTIGLRYGGGINKTKNQKYKKK